MMLAEGTLRLTRKTPVVLVFGGRASDEDIGHATAAWSQIADQHGDKTLSKNLGEKVIGARKNLHPAAAVELTKALYRTGPSGKVDPRSTEDEFKSTSDEFGRRLIPIPYLDDERQGDAWLRSQLFDYLRAFDVWAILAVGRAAVTHRLLKALSPLPIPVLVTLSSVTTPRIRDESGGWSYTHVLNLYPSNDTQAQVISAEVRTLLAQHRTSAGEVYVLKATAQDPYVLDLARELEWHLRVQSLSLRDAREAQPSSSMTISVCIGYDDLLAEVESMLGQCRHVILCDGIAGIVAQQRRRTVHRVRPVLAPALQAAHGYCAIRDVLRDAYWAATTGRGVDVASFIERVRVKLERNNKDYYEFANGQNRRASYLIQAESKE